MEREKRLFSDYTFETFFSNNSSHMRSHIERYTTEFLTSNDLSKIYEDLENRYLLQFPTLETTISKGEFDKNQPIVRFRVAFTGDKRFFESKSDKSWTNEIPPIAEIGHKELIFVFSTDDKPIIGPHRMEILRSEGAMPTPENIARWPHGRLAEINKWLNRFRGDIERLNEVLRQDMRSKIEGKLSEWRRIRQRQEELERKCNQ